MGPKILKFKGSIDDNGSITMSEEEWQRIVEAASDETEDYDTDQNSEDEIVCPFCGYIQSSN